MKICVCVCTCGPLGGAALLGNVFTPVVVMNGAAHRLAKGSNSSVRSNTILAGLAHMVQQLQPLPSENRPPPSS